jgi:hypothetical protein
MGVDRRQRAGHPRISVGMTKEKVWQGFISHPVFLAQGIGKGFRMWQDSCTAVDRPGCAAGFFSDSAGRRNGFKDAADCKVGTNQESSAGGVAA